MRKLILLLVILMAIMVSGCTTEQGSSGGAWGSPSGHQGHNH